MRHYSAMRRNATAFLPAGALAGAVALVAGCAAVPERDPGALAVRAFATLCTPLEEAGIAGRAEEFAFAPVDVSVRTGAVPAALRRDGVRTWVRQGGDVRALLVWNGNSRTCELGVGGIDSATAARAFDTLVAGYARNGQVVTAATVRPTKKAGLALRQSVTIGPPALLPGATRVLALSTDERPGRPIQAVLTMRAYGNTVPVGPDDATPFE